MPASNEALHDEHMMLTALITNVFSLVACMSMLITIRCGGEYVVVKQRCVRAATNISLSFLFLTFPAATKMLYMDPRIVQCKCAYSPVTLQFIRAV